MSGPYSIGPYGVGPYGMAIEVPFKAAGGASSTFGGAARFGVRTGYRCQPGASTFPGRARFTATLRATGFAGASRTAGAARLVLSPVLHPLPTSWTAGGVAYWILDPGDDETIHTKAAPWSMAGAIRVRQDMRAIGWRAAAQAAGSTRSNVQVQARGWRGSNRFDGRAAPLLLQTLDLQSAGSRFDARQPYLKLGYDLPRNRGSFRFDGRASIRLQAVYRARGSFRFDDRMRLKALFRGTFGPIGMRFVAYGAISYSWSDLTAPGRNPLDPWGTAPDANGNWTPAPVPVDPWSSVATPADLWTEAPASGKNWHDVE